jgi:hypothetical protein
MTTFDLARTPAAFWPELALEGLFLSIGVGLLIIAIVTLRLPGRGAGGLGDRLRRMAWFLLPFSLIWLTFTTWMSLNMGLHAQQVSEDIRLGKYVTLEGCLQNFRPGISDQGRSTAGDESWTIADHEFSYGANEVRFAYHTVEPLGGIVHADSWMTVSFVRDEFLGRDDIVRLVGLPHRCPPAPDIPER